MNAKLNEIELNIKNSSILFYIFVAWVGKLSRKQENIIHRRSGNG